jgi:hypothetical protein
MIFISFSSFATRKIIKKNFTEAVVTIDSLPTASPKVDSVWVSSGYGWSHFTYRWIPAHWEAASKKNTAKVQPAIQVTDSASITATIKTRIWVAGHLEFIHNNYEWIPGHWVNSTVPAAKDSVK